MKTLPAIYVGISEGQRGGRISMLLNLEGMSDGMSFRYQVFIQLACLALGVPSS